MSNLSKNMHSVPIFAESNRGIHDAVFGPVSTVVVLSWNRSNPVWRAKPMQQIVILVKGTDSHVHSFSSLDDCCTVRMMMMNRYNQATRPPTQCHAKETFTFLFLPKGGAPDSGYNRLQLDGQYPHGLLPVLRLSGCFTYSSALALFRLL